MPIRRTQKELATKQARRKPAYQVFVSHATSDVFISHGLRDREFAVDVADRLQAAGLQPFYDASIPNDQKVSDAIWDALAECHAFLVIVSPDSSLNALGMVELGAATAWNKPVYVLVNGPASTRLPEVLANYPAFPRNRLDEVLTQIRRNLTPITDDERQVLTESYRAVGVTTDRLSESPPDLSRLAKAFNLKTGKHLSETRLMSELIRMRKQASLPHLTASRRSSR